MRMRFFSHLFTLIRGGRGTYRRKSPRSWTARRALLRVEPLETRTLLSGATISGYVFSDTNHNGLFDAGEAVIANSPIELLDSTGKVVGSTTTDANGYYIFSTDALINTTPATKSYTATFPATATNWSGSQTVPQFDTSLGTLTEVDITVSDPLTSTIKIENLDSAAATIHASVTGTAVLTGPSLTGLSSNLSATQTFNAAAFDGTIDFGGPSGETVGPITTPASGSITLTKASDLAPYLGSGTVTLTETAQASSSASGSGNLVLSVNTTVGTQVTVTYHYIPSNNLPAGSYTIVQTSDPTGFLDGATTAGNTVPVPNSFGSNKIPVVLAMTNLTNNDFAEIPYASLAGSVYVDTNNNGARDNSEAGISGDTVTLTGADFQGNAISVTQPTGTDGSYHFTNLSPGTYTLKQDQPSGYLDGKDTIGSQGGTVGLDQFTNINLGAGVQGVNNNFGELKPSSLAGFVYLDSNNNGVKDAGESGIGNDTVTLTGTDDTGAAIHATQTTAADGSYSFTSLRPGTYTITQDQPKGYSDGKDSVGSLGGAVGADQFTGINLGSGASGVNYNFGEIVVSSLSGFVYSDINNNGVKDAGENGIGGDTITLTGATSQGQAVNLTQTTGADGSYSFGQLQAGTYTITQAPPWGYLDGKDSIGSQGGTVGPHLLTTINLGAGVQGINNNFGELLPASMWGFVYQDRNNNGVKDGGEAGIPGNVLVLSGIDDQGHAVSATQSTDANGFYDFVNLRPGKYTITQTPPWGFLDGKATIGSQGGTAAADQLSNINLGVGIVAMNNNFGELPPASLWGFVYYDANNDGIKQPTEPGLGGMTVTLTGVDDLGNHVAATQMTDVYGFYDFVNLRPGTYTISLTQPSAYVEGKSSIGSQGGIAGPNQLSSIQLSAGVVGTDNDFGELLPAISGSSSGPDLSKLLFLASVGQGLMPAS
jgi:protocatechuate 3,4-dioxygenase beta subunit